MNARFRSFARALVAVLLVAVTRAGPAAADAPSAGTLAPAPLPSRSPTTVHAPPVLPLPASPLPTVDVVLAAIEQGGGVDLKRQTVVTTVVRGGLAGETTEYRDGDDERTVDGDGPLHEERGRRDGIHWHSNYNGEIVIDTAAAGKAVTEQSTSHVERAPEPLDAFVLVRSSRSDIRRTTVERTTGRVLRVDVIRPNGRQTWVYDDFRTTAGDVRPWHWTYRDGQTVDDAEYRIVRLDTGAIAASDLAIPNGRVLVEFPAGVQSVVLPATERDGKFLVRVTIAGRGLDFELDTGASAIVIDEGVARELGLSEIARSSNPANAGRYTSTTTVVPEMKVGTLTMHEVAISTVPDFHEEEPGIFKAVGLLGFDFIADTKLALDYERGTVTAYDRSRDFPVPLGSKGFVVPVRLGTQTPETDVTINGALGEHFMIDSGGAGAMLVFDRFARLHPDALVDDGSGGAPDVDFLGVGGSFATRPYRLKSVRLGNVNLADFTAYRVLSNAAYAGSGDGLLGSEFLSLFTVYLDYPDGAIGFDLNATGRSGIVK